MKGLTRLKPVVSWRNGSLRVAAGVSWLRVEVDGVRTISCRGRSDLEEAYELFRMLSGLSDVDEELRFALGGGEIVVNPCCATLDAHVEHRGRLYPLWSAVVAELAGWLGALIEGEWPRFADDYRSDLFSCDGEWLYFAGHCALSHAEACDLLDALLSGDDRWELQLDLGSIAVAEKDGYYYVDSRNSAGVAACLCLAAPSLALMAADLDHQLRPAA